MEGGFEGAPLWEFDTEFVTDAGVFDPADLRELEVSILWSTEQLHNVRPDIGARQVLTPVVGRPGAYAAFETPPARAQRGGLAVGRIILTAPGEDGGGGCRGSGGILGGMEDFVVVWRPLDEEAGGAWEIRAVRRRADCYWVPEACMWICSGCPDELGGPAEAAGDGGDGGDGGDADGRARVRLRRASAPGRFQPPCVE